jgi:hypothetical protein
MMTERVAVPADAHVTLRLELAVERGRVCAGVLDATQQKWIVVADRLASEYAFDVGTSPGFCVVLANCNGRAEGNEATRFTLVSSGYAVADEGLYADRLVDMSQRHRSR